MAHAKLDEVRRRYGFRCGYCSISEINSGGELTVDHYQPLSVGGDDSDDNLVYCCSRCNLYKGNFAPSSQGVAGQRRVLHPLRDKVDEHLYCEDNTGLLEPLSETGLFHIELLHLNRPALVAHRLEQRFTMMITARGELLESENRQLRTILEARERYIAFLRQLLASRPSEEEPEEEP